MVAFIPRVVEHFQKTLPEKKMESIYPLLEVYCSWKIHWINRFRHFLRNSGHPFHGRIDIRNFCKNQQDPGRVIPSRSDTVYYLFYLQDPPVPADPDDLRTP